ncbi:MazG family protein [Microbacterium sp. SORGH_AS_0888]|uniref:MazG family protein n=1 Tax=Microbacterium sp. SORGH_AS_0888 TaxID=3041791 RepID=UPI0027D8F5AD|nr:MazG family protein [Microbacterium sp. SORGH_AS_0888]
MHEVRERCVWTQEVDHRALVPYLVEESHEVIEAVETGDRAALREELGDLLWQVLFHAEIASRDAAEAFDIDDVAGDLADKMVRRHPHVFADAVAETPEQVLVHWNAAKAAEKRSRTSVLDGVPFGMPALALAQKVLAKSARPVRRAETGEKPAGLGAPDWSRGHEAESEAELGEALLALVALARRRGWDAERALRERVRALATEIRAAEAADASGAGGPRDRDRPDDLEE